MQRTITQTKSEERTKFQNLFGDSVQVRVVEFFLEADKVAFPVEAVVEDKDVGKSQAYEIIENLLQKKYLILEKVSLKKRYYRLNLKNPVVRNIRNSFKKMLVSD